MNPARVFYSEFWEKKKYEFSRTKKSTNQNEGQNEKKPDGW